jgi:hypothetical protein
MCRQSPVVSLELGRILPESFSHAISDGGTHNALLTHGSATVPAFGTHQVSGVRAAMLNLAFGGYADALLNSLVCFHFWHSFNPHLSTS